MKGKRCTEGGVDAPWVSRLGEFSQPLSRWRTMSDVFVIDLAKHVFQVHMVEIGSGAIWR